MWNVVMWNVVMWNVVMRNVVMRNVECGMWNVEFGVWRMAWCMVYGVWRVWCMVYGECVYVYLCFIYFVEADTRDFCE
jgi:hypothetical protein